MAPSRRRGAGKAAAAAASRRQWKVGDLVLAKLKGFPAWPATVSEPEKWGYPPDLKKVLVYFFGTQQIAFCNPADIEAFTEEKKQSLLVKRQGKGVDFVRAVQEIIDSYEKSKKQNQIDDFNPGGEVTNLSSGNSEELLSHFEMKDRREACQATAVDRNNPCLQMDKAVDVAQISSLHVKESLLEQAINDVVATGKPTIAMYTSRKRSGSLRSRKRVREQKGSAPERSRSLSLLDSCRLQNLATPSSDANRHAGDASTNLILASLQSSKQIRKSPDASECDDVDSSTFVLSDSIEEHGSEVIPVDSDSFSLNEGSTIDSSCKEHSQSVVECLEGDDELNKVLDFRIQAVVVKKKRKPITKRVTNGAAEPTARLKREADLEVGQPNGSQTSENACENLNDRNNREEGDKHLPLVKRARVRMGKPSPLQEENNRPSLVEEKASAGVAVKQFEVQNSFCEAGEQTSQEVAAYSSELISPSRAFNDECPADRDSFGVKVDLEKLSPVKVCTEIFGNGAQILKVMENQSGCSDGEAALPPSKRLHRALEAMSANTAEEGQLCAETSKTRMLISGNSTSNARSSLTTAVREEINGSGERSEDTLGYKASEYCSVAVVEESIKSSSIADIGNQSIEISKREEPCAVSFVGESCKDVFSGAMDHDESKVLVGQCSGTDNGSLTLQAEVPKHLTPDIDTQQVILQTSRGSLEQLVLAKDEDNPEEVEISDFRGKIPDEKLETSEHSGMRPHLISQTAEATEATSPTAADGLQQAVRGMASEFLRSQTDDYSQSSCLFDGALDAKHDQRKETGFCLGSIDCLGEDGASHVQLSPLPANGLESPARTSPPATTLCDVSTSESANFIQNTVYSSPNTHSQKMKALCTSVAHEEKIEMAMSQRPKSVSKGSNCAEALSALSTFGAVLGSLTRTKESIGRATRIAIHCAKFGTSSKVVEILARNLESESSMHKRVDLFFLVDSIIQCSRGLKGDFGGVYPSAIQAALPRLLSAAAACGSYAQENQRQCLKVLRLWLERRIFPESVIRHHIRELDSLGGSSSAGAYSRRSARTERSLDDPVRDMEGMLVDEYGSNSSFQLLGFCMPRMLKDDEEGSESDGEGFEAVTPEHRSETPEDQETNQPAVEKHTCILEDVDGELEMEDVAPTCDNDAQNLCPPHEQHLPRTVSPLPESAPPSSPPLPSSPPPPPPPPPPLASRPSCNMQDDLRHQQSDATRINPSVSNAVHYHASQGRDQMWRHVCDSTGSCSGYLVRPFNDFEQTDGHSFHHKQYPPRPPHHPPSHHFSYVHPRNYTRSRRETSSPSHRFHSSHNADAGNFYDNHERMRPSLYEQSENWRYTPPSFHGPQYPEKAKVSYGSGLHGGLPQEPSRLHHGWDFPRGMHNRNFVPFRPPFDSAVPVANRAPGMWRPR
uniref:Protein HUA2-LIKE 2 n=1 Tax=Rhizophora mucronata TaxID=61149 RepID=A0A2P2LKI4_RHIMU